MFTGIVEETGIVEKIRRGRKAIELSLRLGRCGAGLKIGDSLAVNGCCLTVVKLSGPARARIAQFDLLLETWNRTNLQYADSGSMVNLERPLAASGRFDGHFVTGHIDGLGQIVRWERSGQDHLLDIKAPSSIMRQVVFKGSIAVDGISLTIADVGKQSFRIWIIPHTYEVTALRQRGVGDFVSIETDLIGKYVEKFLAIRPRRS